MKDSLSNLKIFCFTHPLMDTEWPSLFGDKYYKSLPFTWEMTDKISEAQIIVWDGVRTSKNSLLVETILENLKNGKVLLQMGESSTLVKENSMVEFVSTKGFEVVELSGWSVLPEEIMAALIECHKKLGHV